jgi:microcystin-dependent protein
MAQPYVGEIRLFGGNFAPAGWAFCDGSLLSIPENETLFQLIGTTFGGDGQTTYALPDLRGRVPVHQGAGFVLAETGGVESVSLTTNTLPSHNHALNAATGGARQTSPLNNALAAGGPELYASARALPGGTLGAALASSGGNQPHENMAPFLAVSYIISLFGIFPSPA